MKTVRDLIEELQKLSPDLLVGMSSDSEGNSIEDWSGSISYAFYNENEYRGDQFSSFIYDEDTDDEDEVSEETANAVIIWP